MKHMRR